ncbi:hypothetical protein KFU94_44185 [Chloroflexi bacterium TSY]|nr:hypothetical protein [Chloroflexi bacterium TSY]
MQQRTIFALLLILCLGVSACAAPTAVPQEAAGPKVLVVASSQEPENLFIMWGSTRTGSDAMSFMWRRPIAFNGDNEPYAALLESLPSQADGTWVVDEEAATMEVTYKFKEGLKWSDGEEITADDLAFAFEILSDPDSVDPNFRF